MGQFAGAIALVGVGAIVALVGYIGILLGLWRLGTRYNEPMFKVGMVLIIFPLLDIVGYVLLLVASRNVTGRVRARGRPIGGLERLLLFPRLPRPSAGPSADSKRPLLGCT